jgi:hypothetical protein
MARPRVLGFTQDGGDGAVADPRRCCAAQARYRVASDVSVKSAARYGTALAFRDEVFDIA